MIDRHRQGDILPDRHHHLLRRAAILAPSHARLVGVFARLLGSSLGQVLDPDLQLQLLPDDAKARRLRDDEPPVAFVRLSGQQNMQRGGDRLPQRVGVAGRHVMHLAVGDHDDPGEALARDIGHRPIERLEQPRAFVAVAAPGCPRPDHP